MKISWRWLQLFSRDVAMVTKLRDNKHYNKRRYKERRWPKEILRSGLGKRNRCKKGHCKQNYWIDHYTTYYYSSYDVFDVEYYRDLEMWVRGHSRSLKMLPFTTCSNKMANDNSAVGTLETVSRCSLVFCCTFNISSYCCCEPVNKPTNKCVFGNYKCFHKTLWHMNTISILVYGKQFEHW